MAAADGKPAAFGGVWLEEDGDAVKLSIKIGKDTYSGKKNEKKSADTHPDYRIFSGEEDCGAAWKGITKNGNVKLSIKIKGIEKTLTAVMRKDPKGNEPMMTIMDPNN